MLDKLKKADFDPHIHSTFELIHPETEDAIKVELIEAEERNTNQTECLSLIFKGPKDKVMPQNTYTLKHDKMEAMDLFTVPVLYGKDDGVYYQIIFNRMKS